ncbi:MAG: hypothetical protein JW986_07705 [Methanotrichaceae archaeon]|nr:hypothetical protein [Methanotrichaceae archaeon]
MNLTGSLSISALGVLLAITLAVAAAAPSNGYGGGRENGEFDGPVIEPFVPMGGPGGHDDEPMMGWAGPMDMPPDHARMLYGADGFAFEGDRPHTLSIHIGQARFIPASYVRGLLAENKTLDQIRQNLLERNATVYSHGMISFDGKPYRLDHISLILGENGSSLEADLVDPRCCLAPWCDRTESCPVLGGIALSSTEENPVIGQGQMTIFDGDRAQSYSVVVDAGQMQFPMH